MTLTMMFDKSRSCPDPGWLRHAPTLLEFVRVSPKNDKQTLMRSFAKNNCVTVGWKKQIWCYISCFAPVQTAIFRIVSCIFTNDPQHWLGSDVIIPGVAAGSLTTVAGTLQWIILKTHFNSSNRVAFCLNSIYNFINLEMCESFDQSY